MASTQSVLARSGRELYSHVLQWILSGSASHAGGFELLLFLCLCLLQHCSALQRGAYTGLATVELRVQRYGESYVQLSAQLSQH